VLIVDLRFVRQVLVIAMRAFVVSAFAIMHQEARVFQLFPSFFHRPSSFFPCLPFASGGHGGARSAEMLWQGDGPAGAGGAAVPLPGIGGRRV
jgi:hypothetical protein